MVGRFEKMGGSRNVAPSHLTRAKNLRAFSCDEKSQETRFQLLIPRFYSNVIIKLDAI